MDEGDPLYGDLQATSTGKVLKWRSSEMGFSAFSGQVSVLKVYSPHLDISTVYV